ncbi:MAG: alpha/beta hydrolase family protein [Methylobacter sp.]|nr:alpha/beta hydrolase family protein [Methylobacter sp.]
MKLLRSVVFVLCMARLLGDACWAGDEKREADFADGINKTLAMGKAVWLESEGKKFLGLYTETEKVGSKGVVIILHDMGGHPNQQQLIYGLRVFLPEHNWATLSLQMPLREAGADMREYYSLFPEAAARIQAGIDYARSNGAENIAVVGYGLGGLMGIYALSEQEADIKALVTISLPVPATENKAAQTLELIKKIKIPMLDIYGALDVSDVTDSARDRRLAAKENTAYRQIKIDDEGHAYLHDEGLLVKRIYSWLGVTVAASAAPNDGPVK